MDYVDKLSDKEKEWLNAFISETVITNFNHRGKKLIKSKKKRRELYNDNNRRNNDVYAVSKATHNLNYTGNKQKENSKVNFFQESKNDWQAASDQEDALLTAIDIKDSIKKGKVKI